MEHVIEDRLVLRRFSANWLTFDPLCAQIVTKMPYRVELLWENSCVNQDNKQLIENCSVICIIISYASNTAYCTVLKDGFEILTLIFLNNIMGNLLNRS